MREATMFYNPGDQSFETDSPILLVDMKSSEKFASYVGDKTAFFFTFSTTGDGKISRLR